MEILINREKSGAQAIVESNLRRLTQPGMYPFKLVERAEEVFGEAYGFATEKTVDLAMRSLAQKGELRILQPALRTRERWLRPA